MSRITIGRTINAPVDKVFDTLANINQFRQAIPHIVKVEFLSDTKAGVGTRFRETRLMRGKEVSNDLEVVEYVPNEHVRIVADTHGTVWDTVFSVRAKDGLTELTMVMDARPHQLLPKIMTPLIMPMVTKAIVQDMDSVKAFCEK